MNTVLILAELAGKRWEERVKCATYRTRRDKRREMRHVALCEDSAGRPVGLPITKDEPRKKIERRRRETGKPIGLRLAKLEC